MKTPHTVKAILFDSGRVLNAPASGHWFISPNFWEYVDKEKYDCIEKKRISHAFHEAEKYVSAQKLILTKDEEYQHFIEFYKIFAENLPELGLELTQIEMLAKDLVYNAEKYVFYEDALQMLPQLSQKYKLAIVSDAWPSLMDVYREQKIADYFDCFVISSMIGMSKPHEKMFTTALEELAVSAANAVFIDDNLNNCIGAMKLGIHSILLCRNKYLYIWNKLKSIGKGYDVFYSLRDLDS